MRRNKPGQLLLRKFGNAKKIETNLEFFWNPLPPFSCTFDHKYLVCCIFAKVIEEMYGDKIRSSHKTYDGLSRKFEFGVLCKKYRNFTQKEKCYGFSHSFMNRLHLITMGFLNQHFSNLLDALSLDQWFSTG